MGPPPRSARRRGCRRRRREDRESGAHRATRPQHRRPGPHREGEQAGRLVLVFGQQGEDDGVGQPGRHLGGHAGEGHADAVEAQLAQREQAAQHHAVQVGGEEGHHRAGEDPAAESFQLARRVAIPAQPVARAGIQRMGQHQPHRALGQAAGHNGPHAAADGKRPRDGNHQRHRLGISVSAVSRPMAICLLRVNSEVEVNPPSTAIRPATGSTW
jgi:hypothetical protein